MYRVTSVSTMRRFVAKQRAYVLASVLATSAWGLGPQTDTVSIPAHDPATAMSETPERTLYQIPLPEPIRDSDLRLCGWLLDLSDAQAQSLSTLYEEFNREQADQRVRVIRPLLDRSADIYEENAPGSLESSLELQDLFKTKRPGVLRKLAQLDQVLFDNIALLLNENQMARMQLLRDWRRRAEMPRSASRYPGGDVDMLILLDRVMAENETTSITDSEKFDAFVVAYSAEATPIFQDRFEAIVKCRSDGSVIQKQYLNGLINREWGKDQVEGLRRRLLRAEERIHDLNVRYLDLFAGVLNDESATAFRTSWRELVYTPVYPDPTDTTGLFEAALKLDSLSPKSKEQVETLQAAIEFDHAALNEAMIRRVLEYRKEQGIAWRFGEIYDRYEVDLLRLHDQRTKLAKQEIEWLRASIPADAWSLVESQAASIVANIEQFKLIPDRRRGFDPNSD